MVRLFAGVPLTFSRGIAAASGICIGVFAARVSVWGVALYNPPYAERPLAGPVAPAGPIGPVAAFIYAQHPEMLKTWGF